MRNYTVKQLADLSGVSVRTLHHYDAIGLLVPAYVGDNGYRIYERAQVLRLQQILFYRQLDMALVEIGKTLDSPDFDLVGALKTHRKRLVAEQKRFSQLLLTIDKTLNELNGEKTMTKSNPLREANPFKGFSPARQAIYENELVDTYGAQAQLKIDESKANIGKLSSAQMDAVKDEGHQINLGLVACIEAGDRPADETVQALIARQHAWVSVFWVPNRAAYIGLGQSYCDNADFRKFYDKYDPRLVEFLAAGMKVYAQEELN